VGVLNTLELLDARGETCGDTSLVSKKYSAHINHAIALEQQGEVNRAAVEYRSALGLNGNGREALLALFRLQKLPTPTPAPCVPANLPQYAVSDMAADFAQANEGGLVLGKEMFRMRGVNYYPRRTPWERFIPEAELKDIAQEFDLIAEAGFNAVRIFLDYGALFTCDPERAVPNARAFIKLDRIIALAAERKLKLVVTLNDLPDLYYRPIYTDWSHYDAQTQFIVRRYRDEPGILMWDLRNEGDLDHSPERNANFTKKQVLDWLEHISAIVRENDPNHLLTAGWLEHSADTLPSVDVVSFHHWNSVTNLQGRVRELQQATGKPILLEEVGYSASGNGPEATQADALESVIAFADNHTAGWMIWTAFDFRRADDPYTSPEYYFGLWRTDLTPKPALRKLEAILDRN
jgi:endo-1,4-beta-mannosidase